jgi:DNA modification methylase
MNKINKITKGFNTAEARWSRFGPYYAMFPIDFAFQVVKNYSKKNDFVLDPFAGRYSSIYAAAALGRKGVGIEINPIGWLYGNVKLNPAPKEKILKRLEEIYNKRNLYTRAIEKLPKFYKVCFSKEVLKFLLSARRNLKWQNNKVDATLMSFLVLYLHGKIGEGLSNQMQMAKAMGMNYSIKWWKEKKLSKPPEINPFEFLSKRIEWRYSKGIPNLSGEGYAEFGDSSRNIKRFIKKHNKKNKKFSLLFTSPPYHSITDYHIDQWLRMWLLGGSEIPKPSLERYKGRFGSKIAYKKLLEDVFKGAVPLMGKKSVIYIRTDSRKYTLQITLDILKKYFPLHKIKTINKPFKKKNQTELFGNKTNKEGEVDIILRR